MKHIAITCAIVIGPKKLSSFARKNSITKRSHAREHAVEAEQPPFRVRMVAQPPKDDEHREA